MELTITRLGIDLSVVHAGEPVKVVPSRLLASERRRALRPTVSPGTLYRILCRQELPAITMRVTAMANSSPRFSERM
ncbi:hypothetical protein BT69DRAFT_1285857 [Atractiella rhizophila]|nr:hypothetical protein BT69DRAFT_1285857 [Atractiella rhizophila]